MLAAAAPTNLAAAAEPQTIYLAPDDHTDYLWTLDEAGYQAAFVTMLDFYLAQMDATRDLPQSQQGRWSCDGSYWLRVYEQQRGAAALARVMERVRDGHLSVPLNTLVSTYGGQPVEAVLRGLYHAGRLERRFNLRLPLAVAMENQTLPFGLGSLFAGAGARYSWRGICGCASKVPDAGQRPLEIYRWTGFDGSSLLMKWNSVLTGGSQHLGGYAEARDPAAMVEFLSSDPRFKARWPYAISAAFGKGWDDPQTLTREFVDVAVAKSRPDRQVVVSNQVDFFQDFEARYGRDLPTQALAFGNEWDSYSASLAEVSASVRRAVEGLRGGEALATLVAQKGGGGLWDGKRDPREEAHVALGLYWEHNWTADGPISKDARAAWQRRLATTIGAYSQGLTTDAAAALGGLIRGGDPSAGPRYAVFNSLSFARSEAVDLPFTPTSMTPPKVIAIDDGQEVPAQLVTVNGARRLRVLCRDLPAVGYRVYQVQGAPASALPDAATASAAAGTLDGEFYRLTLTPRGALSSLQWKPTKRELAQAQGPEGRLLNDLGAAAGGTLSIVEQGPVSVTLQASAPAPLAHTTRVTLTRGVDRVTIENEITQNFADVRTWGFGFKLTSPNVWHEEVGAVLRARLARDGGHYADQRGRYDWLTLNHFADISGADVGVTLSSADLAFFRLGLSTPSALDSATPLLSVLAGGQVDGAALGIVGQGGDRRFLQRFALRAHGLVSGDATALDAPAAMRFALAHQNPPLALAVRGDASAPYPEGSYSLLSLSDPRVLLWALKPAEDGAAQGAVARLWNLAQTPVTVTLRAAAPLLGARQVTHIETRLGAQPIIDGAALTLTLQPQQLYSVSLWDTGEASGGCGSCSLGAARRGVPGKSALGLLLGGLGALLLRRRRRASPCNAGKV